MCRYSWQALVWAMLWPIVLYFRYSQLLKVFLSGESAHYFVVFQRATWTNRNTRQILTTMDTQLQIFLMKPQVEAHQKEQTEEQVKSYPTHKRTYTRRTKAPQSLIAKLAAIKAPCLPVYIKFPSRLTWNEAEIPTLRLSRSQRGIIAELGSIRDKKKKFPTNSCLSPLISSLWRTISINFRASYKVLSVE